MTVALRWREDPFDCEFTDVLNGGILRMFLDGHLISHEIVRSAAAACERARDLRQILLPGVRRQA